MTDTHLAQDELFPSSHTNERRISCRNCGEAEPFDGQDDCLKCFTAYLLHEDPDAIYDLRRQYAGSYWLGQIDAEIERQSSALLSSGLMLTVPVQGFSKETEAWLKSLGVKDEEVVS